MIPLLLPLAVSGGLVDMSLTAAVVVASGLLAFLVLRKMPHTAVVIAMGSIAFIPIWFGVPLPINGNVTVPAAAAAAMLAIAVLLPVSRFRFSAVDLLPLLLIIISFSSLVTGNGEIAMTFIFTLLIYFLSGYLLGRIAPGRVDIRWIYGAVGVIFTIVAVFVIVEFATGWNPFLELTASNPLFAEWGGVQERGGIVRAEGAFGHAIALGSCLAMAIPLTLASRFPFVLRGAMVASMLVATTFSFSRTGIIGALLGLLLSLVFLRGIASLAQRITLLAVSAIAAVAAFPLVLQVFADAGDEAAGSAEYRGDLFSLLDHSNFIGFSDLTHRSPDGKLYFGAFQSIDSQFILTAVTNGTLTLAAVILALLIAIVMVLTGRATAPTIAIVAQIPALATVSLITQYSIFLWFIVGLAASSQLRPQGSAPAEFAPAPARESPLVRLTR